jgi:CHASE2 domain-containing sensor protein
MSADASQKKSDAANKSGDSFWKYYFFSSWTLHSLRSLRVNPCLLVLAISFWVSRYENLRIVVEMQSWSLDLCLGFMHAAHLEYPCPRVSDDIYIVSITDSDYRNRELFKSSSPLDPETIKKLLGKVLDLGPAVVGVDLDTKDPTVWDKEVLGPDCPVKDGVPTQIRPGSGAVVVWARMPVEGKNKEAAGHSDRPMQLYQVLGGCAGDNDFSGVPRFPLDADGVVRKYVGKFDVDGAPEVGSFARVIAEKYAEKHAEKHDVRLRSGKDERILNFARKKCFQKISSSRLLDIPGENDRPEDTCPTDKDWKRSVLNHIVLIGGEFEDSRDTHDTTPGQVFLPQPLYGVELNAMAIDSDLDGGAIIVVPPFAVFLVDFLLAGPLFVWIFFELVHDPPSPRIVKLIDHLTTVWMAKVIAPRILLFVAATLVTFFIAISFSWALLWLASVWISFIPLLLGANIHQYFEHATMVGEHGSHARLL